MSADRLLYSNTRKDPSNGQLMLGFVPGREPSTANGVQPGTAEVRQGDAFDLIKCLPDDSIDLVLTSPPYWGLRTYGADHN